MNYEQNIFNVSKDTTSINEIHVKAELNKDFHIDLLTIFNNINVDESLIFMQLHGDQGYPIFKIYKDLLNENNMKWISKWCKATENEGRMDVTNDTVFEKLIVKIRLPKNGVYATDFNNEMAYFTLELHPENAVLYIRFYIKSEAHVTVNDFKEIIDYTNKFIQRCSKLNIYTIPLEYLQSSNVNTVKKLKIFADEDTDETVNFFKSINYINISIQEYWNVLNSTLPRSLDTMNKLINWFYNNIEQNSKYGIVLASREIIDNHIPLIYLYHYDYLQNNKDTIKKMIIRFLKHAHMSYTAYRNMLSKSAILIYLANRYNDIFSYVDAIWKEYMNKTTINMINNFTESEYEEVTQKISNLFGVTINIGLNNINVLGILNINLMYIIEFALVNILKTFLENPETVEQDEEKSEELFYDVPVESDSEIDIMDIDMDMDLDDINIDDINIDIVTEPINIQKTDVSKYEIDKKFFEVYPHHNVDGEILKEIKTGFFNFEREIMASELDAINNKKKVTKIQNALTRLQRFNNEINGSKIYASSCQSDKKPIMITEDEYYNIKDQIENGKGRKLTPYGEYIRFIINNANKFDNEYLYFICCMIFDFHERKIINPYCTYVKMNKKLESIYYIPFKTANDLFIGEDWYPTGHNYINRYDESKAVAVDGRLYYPDPSNNDELVEMIKIFPDISRFHCIDFNASKNYVALPYKFVPDIVKKIALPCCFSKTQVIPNTVSNYNNSLNSNNEIYRDYNFTGYMEYVNAVKNYEVKYDGVNRIIRLPKELNILFNNDVEYDKVIQNKWCRRIVFQGYFVSLFDHVINGEGNYIDLTHSENANLLIYRRPKIQLISYINNYLTDDIFVTVKNGLLRYLFKTKDNFLQYCMDNYFKLDEEYLWEIVSDMFNINIFIIQKINKTQEEDEHYVFEFPEGYDLNKLYSHKYSMFVYKYTNSKNEVIYDLIDNVNSTLFTHSINISNFTPYLPSNYTFVKQIIQTLKDTNKQLFFDYTVKSYTPTATEFMNNVKLQIVGQTRTHNLEYTDNIFIKLPSGSTVIMPVYPLSLLPDNIPVINKVKIPMYRRNVIMNIINIINTYKKDDGLVYYYPRGLITNKNKLLGFIFDKNVHMYFKPITYKNEITGRVLNDNTLKVIQQYFIPRNSLVSMSERSNVDDEKDKYISNKNIIKSIIFSIEYLLSIKLTNKEREELKNTFDTITNYDDLGNYLYKFISEFIDRYTLFDNKLKYKINISNVNKSNIISSKDNNLVTTYKGSQIQNCYSINNKEECGNVSTCKWDDNMCKVCFNTKELKENVISYVVTELLSSFNVVRYKVMYGSSFSTEPNIIQNYSPETQYVINARDSASAITTMNNIIRGDVLSSLAENMKIVYTLTHNFNEIQKQQITEILNSLTNTINPVNLYKVKNPVINNTYIVNMNNDADDFWFTVMLNLAQYTNITTIPQLRNELANILVNNQYIQLPNQEKYIYSGKLFTGFFNKMINSKSHVNYNNDFDKMIDNFLSKNYMPSYLDFQALMLAPWNPYNITILVPIDAHLEKDKKPLNMDRYTLYKLDSSLASRMTLSTDIGPISDEVDQSITSELTTYKRNKYLIFIELRVNGQTIYKPLLKYNNKDNEQNFVFTEEEITKLYDSAVDKYDILTLGNMLYPIWLWGK